MEITSSFKENLSQLPTRENITSLTILDSDDNHIGTIENKPGQAGSLVVYCYLKDRFSFITPEAAELGLKIYAEHTDDARLNPGKHPNIDRLFSIIDSKKTMKVISN